VKSAIASGLVNAAHDVSDGGLYVALVEMGIPNRFGFDITGDAAVREDSFLFGEAQGRVIVTINGSDEEDFIEEMSQHNVPFSLLGHVTRGKMMIDDVHFGFIDDAAEVYLNTLGNKMNQ
jgi:phosphoribosylformylglycinamidine synthase